MIAMSLNAVIVVLRRATDWDKATKHFQEMTAMTECRHPVPQLVDVRALHHEANRDYLPRCTVVHRCRSQLACCDRSSEECAVKTSNVIAKSFIVSVNCLVTFCQSTFQCKRSERKLKKRYAFEAG